MNLAAYFERIAYTGSSGPTLETLRQVHRAHLLAVPFENLNIHIPREIVLDEDLLFAKIVNEKRGGYCFEQNGLMAAVLREMGYELQRIEANVYSQERNHFSIPMNHMALVVRLEGKPYLFDVGFGANFVEPLELDNPELQVQENGRFRIEQQGETGFLYSQMNGEEAPELSYRFYLNPHELEDYEAANDYMQHSQHSGFTKRRVCSQLKADGRYTLSDKHFVYTTWDGTRSESPIHNEEHFHALLAEHFGIHLQTQAPQAVLEA